MNKTVFSNPTAKESHSRNAFPRSIVKNYNFSGGMLLPTFCQFYFGRSHARINQRSFIRTSDVNTAAFPSLPFYTDYFFVPMHQILSNWNAFRSLTNDRFSSRLGNISRLPSFGVSDFRSMIAASISSTLTDESGADLHLGSLRLADLLEYGWNFEQYSIGGANYLNATGNQTPLKLAVYQKIYYDYYRNTAYESNDVEAYNLDDLYTLSGDNETVGSISTARLQKFFKIHYVNYKRDYYNTIYPSLNFISASANGLQSQWNLPNSVLGIGYINAGGLNTGGNYVPVVSSDGMGVSPSAVQGINTGSVQSGFTLQNLRAAFALDKLIRCSSFAPQHVKDQFMARFGYSPKSSSMHESVRLGSFKNDVIIGEVTSTAAVDPSAVSQRLGSIGGKGVGSAGFEKVISYDVPEDGFIMGISYVLPVCTYDSDRVDPINQQFVPEDWSQPEYENLGLQPLYNKNLFMQKLNNTETDASQLAKNNGIAGYQPRDMQFKTAVSLNHGQFRYSGALNPWVLHGRIDWLRAIANTGGNGVSYKYFKCIPNDLNFLFVNQADGDERNDQFFGNIAVESAVIMDKPIFGVPQL